MALTRIKTDQILDGTITGSDIASDTDITSNNLTLSGDLRGPATFTIDPAAIGDNTGTVVIAGDLQVDGETTTINSSTLTVDDKQIVIASGATDNTSADGAGILIDGANATITYDGTNDRFEINKDVQIIGGSISGTDVDVSGATFTVANDQISGDAINGGTATPTTLNSTNLNVDSGTLFVDSANNRVGIGTSSPDVDLEINSGGNNIPLGLTSIDTSCFISLRDDSTTLTHGNATVAVGAQADDMLIRTGAAEAVRIEASGNVGIGTSSPNEALQVDGRIQSKSYVSYTVPISDDAVFQIDTGSTIGALIITARNSGYKDVNGIVQWRYGSNNAFTTVIASSPDSILEADTITGVPTGTSGTDGSVTVFARDDANGLFIENRRGKTISINITLLGK